MKNTSNANSELFYSAKILTGVTNWKYFKKVHLSTVNTRKKVNQLSLQNVKSI